MKKIVSLILMTVLGMEVLRAQSPNVWSLEECMDYAVQNSPSVKRQQYSNDNYRQDYISSLSKMAPSVGASVGAASNFGRSIDPETNTYDNTTSFNNTYSLGASIPVFQGFSLINRFRSSKVGRRLGQAELQKVKDDVSFMVMEAYFDVVYYAGAVGMLTEKLAESRQNLLRTRELEALGLKSRADLAQVEAQVATDDANLTKQQNILVSARTRLKNVMNYPLDQPLAVDTLVRMTAVEPDLSSESIFEQARTQHAVARMADYKLRRSQLDYSISRGGLFPSIMLNGGYSTNYYSTNRENSGSVKYNFKQQFKNNRGGNVSVSLSIPIFNNLALRTNVNRSRNYLRIAEQDNAETMRNLQSDIRQAVDDCEGLAREYLQANKQVNATTLAHRVNQRKYDEGLLSPLELQTSANQLLFARVNLLDVKLKYMIKYRLVEYYKGVSLIDQLR